MTLKQFCDPFPFVQFVWYEKGFKPHEKLPLCLIFLCCLNHRKKWVRRKIWMKRGAWADSVAKEFLWRISWQRKARGQRLYMEAGEHSKTWSLLHKCTPWGTEPSCRCQCDPSGSYSSVLNKGPRWKECCGKHWKAVLPHLASRRDPHVRKLTNLFLWHLETYLWLSKPLWITSLF